MCTKITGFDHNLLFCHKFPFINNIMYHDDISRPDGVPMPHVQGQRARSPDVELYDAAHCHTEPS